MTQAELKAELKAFCKKKALRYLDCIPIGRDILILVTGDGSAEKLKGFLSNLGVQHTTPHSISDGIGSYVRL